ncbi:hypothetical protein CWI42_080890 [Ordospora colligata]|uniref:Uncharacterized protein n=1 Tax=Ordospora colligata OC4 TaxID=1354746 RepID=A0A0B2UJ45_9MICR|nr:uncharacterized protein M896_080890 [Ordospora colligata OC4]KHN69353.1 hypothetical protein M896_080890 [Ordospora colligata OC4]TBU14867.1 hypothetical protein CWI41_080880 [Ordospora colligata]TBU14998.1 hypothetical protein CWI40_080900 [Ordospora colligata]TBU18252.1 hypothetical protein CWI42_080890 [Ordospora colligata]
MPVIILIGDAHRYLEKLKSCISEYFNVVHLNNEFRAIRSELSNMDPHTVYIVQNCTMKPQRYEIYCLAKRNETSYCILTDTELSTSKHDMPSFVITEELPIEDILNKLRENLHCNAAHKKKITGSNYLMYFKQIINKVNQGMQNSSGTVSVLKECEDMLLRTIKLNPISLEDLEDAYRDLVTSEMKSRGLA